ncbi:MAG: InlB B-repeat-containing protein [Acidimicrobiales bacterium]
MSWRAGLANCITGVVVATLVSTATTIASPFASAATISQVSPTSGSIDVAGSGAFTVTLAADPSFASVTFANATLGFSITPGGVLSTPGPLTVAGSPYLVTGTDGDGSGDTGTWSFSLTVTNTITQGSPNSGSIDVAGSGAFTQALTAAPGYGPVAFANATLGFSITPGGMLSTPGPLTVAGSPYLVTGTDGDGSGDTGTWSFSLTVTPDAINQASPTSGTTNTGNSASFTSTLHAATGFIGAVTFATTTTGFAITNNDVLGPTGTLSASNTPYVVTGTDSDAYGDTGSWTYSLTVTAPASKSTIIQTSPTSGTVTSTASGAFTSGPITVQGNIGPTSFVTTKESTSLTMSASGLLSTSGPLSVGTYSISGTDTDPQGDSGIWTYTLSVTAVMVTVSFDANGGSGVMTPESASAPTALSLNGFTRARHTFIDWNTAANGSGVSYANGALFPFGATTTLFAQWKSGRAPLHHITFAANGGTGTMVQETHNTPTAISKIHFSRTGYTFIDWNTAANGLGKRFKPGATYAFKTSVTLYASWKKVAKKPSPVVTFAANGGAGTMAPEADHGPTKLTPDHFRRTGYTFHDWDTAPNGSGSRFANGAFYSFATSTTLYAQWKKDKKVIPPPPPPKITGPVVGPFALGSSALSPLLESQIHTIADDVKAKGDKQIALLGYGDKLTSAAERNSALSAKNVELGRTRAQAVATYLQGRLAALGLRGWTISIAAASAAKPGSIQYETKIVIATLS